MTSPIHPRFARAEIHRDTPQSCFLTTPRGVRIRVMWGADQTDALLRSCDGSVSLEAVASAYPRPEEVLSFLEEMQRQGCLSAVEGGSPEHWARFDCDEMEPGRAARTRLNVTGRGRLARACVTAASIGGCSTGIFADVREASPTDPTAVDDLVLVVLDSFDATLLLEFDDRARESGQRWSYLCLDSGLGVFGPHVDPSSGPTFRDLRDRSIAATDLAQGETRFRSHKTSRVARSEPYVPPANELAWIASTFLIDIERWLVGARALASWHVVEVDPVGLQLSRHPVLPMPMSSSAGSGPAPPPGLDPADLLVDSRTGIVTGLTEIRHRAGVNPRLRSISADGCDISRVSDWHNDPVGGGSSFDDPVRAEQAALGEVIERYCGNVVQDQLVVRGSFASLRRGGVEAVDPEELVLFSDRQYDAPGFPFLPFTRETETSWVEGVSLTRGVPARLPASLAYINWYNTKWGETDPPLHGTFYAGVAAGPDLESALVSALLEVVERHTTMVWWMNRPRLPLVTPTKALQSVWSSSRADRIRPRLIALDNEFGIPVMAGVVEDLESDLLTIGFAARCDAEEAALKAWAEAINLHDLSHDLLRHDNPYTNAIRSERLPDQGLKPWASDRRYLDAYRSDFHDVITLICQSQVYLDPRAVEVVRPWTQADESRDIGAVARPAGSDLASLRACVEARGLEIFYADLTTSDVRAAGLTVVRVMVPGTIGNFAAAFPFLGRRRVQDSAVELGWRSSALDEEDLNYWPLPHA